ncbi:MAG: tetratricopeptide repeat protein [Candidatus Saccharimonadaceae bacterium]
MKKFLILSLITTFSFVAFAQKGVLKDAKRSLGSNDLNEARTLIKQATENEATASDPETWKLLGDIGNKAFDNERTNEMVGKSSNADVMYKGLIESYQPYLKADSLAQLPDSKGKVKNKVRKDISSILKANHPYFINGGIHFNEKKDYKLASNFFETYWNIPSLELFEGKGDFLLDSTYQTIKYYAIITAIQADEHSRALNLIKRANKEPFVDNSAYQESDLYELLASEYIQLGDTASYLEVLNDGATKFPKSKYFIPNLINVYIRQGLNEKAMDYLDQAITNDPSNACDLNSVKAALYSEKGEFEKAETEYKKAITQDENCARALEGLAVNYILQAQKIKDASAQMTDRKLQAENDKKTVEFYILALPNLEKFTELLKTTKAEDSQLKSALIKLQNVYYNLSNLGVDKSKELEEVELLLGTK